jgi:cyanophycin synthetase
MHIVRNDGVPLELYSASPPTVSYMAANRSNDKYFTSIYLASKGLPVPETYLVDTQDTAAGVKAATTFFESDRRGVVKPLDAGHGDGITVGVSTPEQLKAALVRADEFSKKAIIQEYFHSPVDVRVTCINYQFVAALARIPARVQGDGKHTVGELIDIANNSGERGKGYTSRLTMINRPGAELFLGGAIDDTPTAHEWVQVIGTANVGTGGETVDVTDQVPDWLKRMAEQAAQSMELPVCGVDFLLAGQPDPDSSLDQLQPVIIELNHCPSLFIHELPIHGSPRPVVAAFLDYLATI